MGIVTNMYIFTLWVIFIILGTGEDILVEKPRSRDLETQAIVSLEATRNLMEKYEITVNNYVENIFT